MEFPVVIFFAFFFLYYIYKSRNKKKFHLSETEYEQAGVEVNFLNSTIAIPISPGKKLNYPVSKIRALRWEYDGNGSVTFIELDDFDDPIHTIPFSGTTQAEQFMHRLTMAIEKSGFKMLRFNRKNVMDL